MFVEQDTVRQRRKRIEIRHAMDFPSGRVELRDVTSHGEDGFHRAARSQLRRQPDQVTELLAAVSRPGQLEFPVACGREHLRNLLLIENRARTAWKLTGRLA